MIERFEEIYANNEWGHGSGEGSYPVHTKGYVKFIESFLQQYDITSVVDMGCGDWQFSRYINWGDAIYEGFDVVESIIHYNKEQFGNDRTKFNLYSGNPLTLPKADLLIAKDVLQHLSNSNIEIFLPVLKSYKYFLITNCINPKDATLNTDIKHGDFRYVDLRLQPFSLQAEKIYEFTNQQTLLGKILLRKPSFHKITLCNANNKL